MSHHPVVSERTRSPRPSSSPERRSLAVALVVALVGGLFGLTAPAQAAPAAPADAAPAVQVDQAADVAADVAAVADAGAVAAADPPDLTKFQKVVLGQGNTLGEAMELTVAPDGRVFFITRAGDIQMYDPTDGSIEIIMLGTQLSVWSGLEDGGLGITLAPDFATSKHLYVYYAPLPKALNANRLSRLTLTEDATTGQVSIDKSSEKVLLHVGTQRNICCHSAGSLQFDGQGVLHLTTGDNTSSSDNGGFSPHDERSGRNDYDAQDSAGNTNDLRGKMLRIIPRADDLGDEDPVESSPGMSYDIPDGNLFGEGGKYATAKYPSADAAKTRPEIYVMGLRNPYRLGTDPESKAVYWGEVGPDSRSNDPGRGPRHQEEFNRTTEAMNGGWPYCGGEVGDDLAKQDFGGAYVDWDFTANRAKTNADGSLKRFPCNDPTGMKGVNDSPNNTGLVDLPPMTDAWIPYSTSAPFKYPEVEGSTPTGAQVYRQSRNKAAKDTAFPAYYEGSVFISEMSRGWIKEVRTNADGSIAAIKPFMTGFYAPGDMEFGPDGSLYVLEYGSGFFSGSPDTKLVRVDYAVNGSAPQVKVAATPSEGGTPLTVAFSSAGTSDPDGGTLTYAWDFGDGGTSTQPNPSHQYAKAGDYSATLKVTDSTGKSATGAVVVNVGNTRPVVDITAPIDGGFFAPGNKVKYDVKVSDKEDGQVDCTKVEVSEGLGHDVHAHPLQSTFGCAGTMTMSLDTDHGEDANIYGQLAATYTDRGGNAGTNGPLVGRDLITLQPKRKQAEHANGRSGVNETGYDDKSGTRPGAGGIITGMGNGNHISYNPMSLAGMRSIAVTYSGSPAAGAAIEVRAGASNGTVVARIPLDGGTQGLYYYKTVSGEITSRAADAGGKPLFFVYTGNGEMNFDEVRFTGDGIASDVAPFVTSATATPADGAAPLKVDFAAAATDNDGDAITYTWDFGVAGTTADTATGQAVSYTYAAPGTYTATVTAKDPSGKSSGKTVQVVVRRACTTAPVPDAGYTMLFNGRDLTGWKQSGPGGFTVEDCTLTSVGGLGLLWNTTKQFADYSLKLQYKTSKDADNSGVFTRFPDPGNDPFVAVDRGHEIQIKEGQPNDEPQKTGSVYNFDREDARNAKPSGEWNDYEIKVVGQTYTMTLNGKVVNTWTSDGSRGTTGYVGLQNHGASDTVSFRNVQIRELQVEEPFVNTVTATPLRGAAPLEVTYTAAGIDRQGDALTYEWDFGDGSPSVIGGATIKHTYTAKGAYTAGAIPIDAKGNRGQSVAAKAVTVLADPVPVATASPSCGLAPLQVAFTGTATDPQGQAVTYAWDFGVDGDTADTSSEASPSYTYATPGTYTATLTVTDPDGNTGATSVRVRALESGVCRAVADLAPFFNNDGISTHANPGDGNFDGGGWAFAAETLPAAVRDNGGSLVVDGVDFEFPSPADGRRNNVEANGQTIPLPTGRYTGLSILGSAHNGDVDQPVTITYADGSTSTAQLRFTDWAVSPKFGETTAVDMPHRHNSGGDTSPRVYLWAQSLPVQDKDLASITLPVDAKLHVFAISATAPGEEPPCDQPRRSDEFDGTELLDNCHWGVRRADDSLYDVTGGALELTAGPGEYNSTPNVITQAAPEGEWEVTTKVTFDPTQEGQQAGLVLAGEGSSGFAKLMFVRKSTAGNEWIEFLKSSNPNNSFDFNGDWNTGGASFDGPFLPADFPTTFWLRMSSDGTDLTGAYSLDGEEFTQVGTKRALAGITKPRVGVMALRGGATEAPVASYDYVRFGGEPVQVYPEVPAVEPTVTSCSRSDDFAAALDPQRWDGILREDKDLYQVADGRLSLQTGPGELTEGSPNLVLQSLPSGGYTAVTKMTLASTAEGQQAGLVMHNPTGGGYLKLAFVNKGGGNRWVEFLRNDGTNNDFSGNWHSGPGGGFGGPFLPGDFPETVYLRFSTADGETFRGEYSVDGTTWETAGDDRAGFGPGSFVGPYALRGPGGTVATAHFDWYAAAPERECADNTAPEVTATATPTTGTAPLEVDFTATGTDADGDELVYTWDFGAGPVEGGTPTGEAVSHTYTEAGTYTATVTATDPSGATGTDTVEIVVDGAQQGRTWIVDAVDETNPVSNKWVSEDTGTSEVTIQVGDTVEWQFDRATMSHDLTSVDKAGSTPWSPPLQEYRDPNGTPVRYTFTKPGTYEYVCVIHGTTMTGTVVVEEGDTEPPVNTPPTADPLVDPKTGAAPLYVHFEARASDADGDTLTYAWDFGDGTAGSTADHAHHSYTQPGRYWPTLTVKDGRGGELKREFEVTVTGGQAPLVRAGVSTQAGDAPLNVTGTASAEDPQGDDMTYRWDFGDPGTATNIVDGTRGNHTYTRPGTYSATFSATDPAGNTGKRTFRIVVGGEPPVDPEPEEPVREIELSASAAPSTGKAPLPVSFGTEVSQPTTVGGDLEVFANGTGVWDDVEGTTTMTRWGASTDTFLELSGVKPSSTHMVHVHEKSCADQNGGAHYRFDETKPFEEANEIWLTFTSDAEGKASVAVTDPQRAGDKAVSLVVHQPDMGAGRIACADFAPVEDDKLTYEWDFGDGTTGTGAAPEHTYTEAGTYDAVVTVTHAGPHPAAGGGGHDGHDGHAGHARHDGEHEGEHPSATATVRVVVTEGDEPETPDTQAPDTRVVAGPSGVTRSRNATFRLGSTEAGSTFECSLDGAAYRPCAATLTYRDLRDGSYRLLVRAVDAAGNKDATPVVRTWRVDTRKPTVRTTGPKGSTRDRTPTVKATVADSGQRIGRSQVTLRVDGEVKPGFRWNASTGRLTWTPGKRMAAGRHTVRVVVVDAAGHRTVTQWRFTVRR
ncbi:PKD domain-containing protein [Nocardioides litoris]|uniref:PKD domain-containing protein n=1 Tax=Nocardioides litoris TaxID=1926648 RepID=UPI001B867218|nr:PKD domain-containing protein [Nocardioides litoris]